MGILTRGKYQKLMSHFKFLPKSVIRESYLVGVPQKETQNFPKSIIYVEKVNQWVHSVLQKGNLNVAKSII